jgi:hypothetical protein
MHMLLLLRTRTRRRRDEGLLEEGRNEGREGRGRCAGSVAVSKLALVPVGDVLCCCASHPSRLLDVGVVGGIDFIDGWVYWRENEVASQ